MNTKKLIPNIITLSNLIFGVISLMLTLQGNYKEAAIAILFGMVLDSVDGRVARRLEVSSEFGKELDSLADLVTFGVAPAILTYSAVLYVLGIGGIIISLGFALCGAIRLARFNVLNIKTYYVGTPITFAGPLMAIFVLLSNKLPMMFYPIASITLSYLMICNIKVPKY